MSIVYSRGELGSMYTQKLNLTSVAKLRESQTSYISSIEQYLDFYTDAAHYAFLLINYYIYHSNIDAWVVQGAVTRNEELQNEDRIPLGFRYIPLRVKKLRK